MALVLVLVLGYTDNVPNRSRQFASNDALSEEHATQVMRMLLAAGVPADVLDTVSKDAAHPVGDNNTATPQRVAGRTGAEITLAE